MFKNILYNLNIYAQIVNIIYVRKVFKEIVEQDILQEKYYLTDKKGKKLKNPLTSPNGNMILELPLPNDIDEDEIERYVMIHVESLVETLINLDLYGLVLVDKKVFFNKYYGESEDEDDVSPEDYGGVLVVVRPDYKRLLKFSAVWIFIILSINELLYSFNLLKIFSIYELLYR